MDYRVELDVFNGPLDLLLYLIKRDELEIGDIPIARITASYLQYLDVLRVEAHGGAFDLSTAGDFIVMAATLMEIKSAMLLPRQAVDPAAPDAAADLSDPRFELVQQLLEYKRLKDNARLLEQRGIDQFNRFARVPARPDLDPDEPPPLDLDEVQVWDLLAAFSRLMSEVGQRAPRFHEVTYDDTPLALHATDIEDRLKREGRMTLRTLLVGRTTRSEMIGVFLALLEMVRQKKVLVDLDETTGDITLDDAPAEHRATFQETLAPGEAYA